MWAARVWVSRRARMVSAIRIARSALARRSSGLGRPMSAKTLPLPSSTSILLVTGLLLLLSFQPSGVFLFGSLQARFDQLNLRFRRLNSGLGLLLERMQSVYPLRQTNRVDCAICIAPVIFHDLQNSRAAKAAQRLGIGVLSATLRYVERIANRVLDLFWKGSEVSPSAPNPDDRLDAG